MSWMPVNKKHKHLEDTRAAFREYVMGDMAGDLEMKMRGYDRLMELREFPPLPARRLANKGVCRDFKIPAFAKVLDAIVCVRRTLAYLQDDKNFSGVSND